MLYVPLADNGVVSVRVQAPPLHVAVPLCVLEPVTATVTVALSPEAVPHAPPTVVTVVEVTNVKVRVTPFTCVSVTAGAVLSTTIVCTLVPVLPAASVCVAVIV